jgi:hypothetical protein
MRARERLLAFFLLEVSSGILPFETWNYKTQDMTKNIITLSK